VVGLRENHGFDLTQTECPAAEPLGSVLAHQSKGRYSVAGPRIFHIPPITTASNPF
jgi:hypothetical protein